MRAEEAYVAGMDIEAGSSPSSLSQPRYSLAVLSSSGTLIHRAEGVRLKRLIDRLWRLKPRILAVDNVYELAKDRGGLLRLIRRLPPDLKLVQVTGRPDQAKPLVEVAALRGLEAPAKPTPLQAALLCAKLALMGEGCEVKLLEPEVKVVVSKARSPGAGGMSHDRFKRDVRSRVLQAMREACEALRSKGVDYDLFIKGSERRPDGALIVAYASRGELKGVVKPYEGRGVRVRLLQSSSGELEFIPRDGSTLGRGHGRYLIVGIDPGVATGLAILDLNGSPLLLTSRRGLDRLWLTRLILSHGIPLIIASDVNPPPALVEKLSSTLNATLFTPSSTLAVDEKRKLAAGFEERYGVRARDSHQRDALAAALKAYMHYRGRLEEAASYARSMGVEASVEELKALVVRGMSVQEAAKRLTPCRPTQPAAKPSEAEEKLKAELKSLREKLAEQQAYTERLESERAKLIERVEELSRKVEELEGLVEKLRREQALRAEESMEVRRLTVQLEATRLQAARLEEASRALEARAEGLRGVLLKWLKGEARPLKPLRSLTPSGVAEAVERFNLRRGDLVLVKDATSGGLEAAEMLAKLRVGGVVSLTRLHPDAKSAFIEHGLAFLESPNLAVEWVEGVPFVDSAPLDSMLAEARRGVEEEGRRRAKEALIDILSRYKLERRRS